MNHQGTSGGISAKDIGKNGNDSARQVYRYIRLTYLMNDLLNAVDRDVIGLQVGVELSYLAGKAALLSGWRSCIRKRLLLVWKRNTILLIIPVKLPKKIRWIISRLSLIHI